MTEDRYKKIIVLDAATTDLALHGKQEGRFFHGYYDCYCYLPLYIFSGCGGSSERRCGKRPRHGSGPASRRVTVRKVWVSMASSYPWQDLYRQVWTNLRVQR